MRRYNRIDGQKLAAVRQRVQVAIPNRKPRRNDPPHRILEWSMLHDRKRSCARDKIRGIEQGRQFGVTGDIKKLVEDPICRGFYFP